MKNTESNQNTLNQGQDVLETFLGRVMGVLEIFMMMAMMVIGLIVFFLLTADNGETEPSIPGSANNAFVELCAKAKPGALVKALKQGASPNAVWESTRQRLKDRPFIYEGNSALQVAVRENRHLESIKLLLDAGADVNAPSGRPLWEAVQRNKPDYVALLLARGALPAVTEKGNEWSLLFTAVSKNPAILEMLLKAGADVQVRTDRGQSALHYAVIADSEAAVRLLLEAGLDPNVTDNDGDTPLHELVKSPSIVEIMAGYGADVNLENNDGLTPFEVNDDRRQYIRDLKPVPGLMAAFMAAGAQLFKQDENGQEVIRGFDGDGTGYARTRFWAADDFDPVSAAIVKNTSDLRQEILSSVFLESDNRAAEASEIPPYNLRFHWTYDNSMEPVENVPYYLESDGGAVVYGQTSPDGFSASLHSPGREKVRSLTQSEAETAASNLFSSVRPYLAGDNETNLEDKITRPDLGETSTATKYGERVCFVHPEKRRLVSGYPYALVSTDSYAITGKTGSNGCTAELFTPGQGAFTVYGGENALRIEVKDISK